MSVNPVVLSALIERVPRYFSLNTDSRQKESAPLSRRSIAQQRGSTHRNCVPEAPRRAIQAPGESCYISTNEKKTDCCRLDQIRI